MWVGRQESKCAYQSQLIKEYIPGDVWAVIFGICAWRLSASAGTCLGRDEGFECTELCTDEEQVVGRERDGENGGDMWD